MPAIGNLNPLTVQYRDYSDEVDSLRLYSGPLTVLTLDDFLSEFGDLQTALDAVTLGVRSKQTWGEESTISNAKPSDKTAQIETQMLVRCYSATTQAPFSFRIPTVDYAAFNYVGDQVILGTGTTTATTNLVNAIQALCKHPANGEALTVIGMEVVR